MLGAVDMGATSTQLEDGLAREGSITWKSEAKQVR